MSDIGSPAGSRRRVRALVCVLVAGAAICTNAIAEPDRLVHRYLETATSPDGIYVADVEGDAPVSGREPVVRDLVIRRVDNDASVTVALPCGRVQECWPGNLVWTRDGRQLSFALRIPGSHARAIYSVVPDGSHLTQLLAFDGTITSLRYGADGRLSMLATESANKEVGATQAGAPITQVNDSTIHEQRIAILENQHLTWVSPAQLYVYEYDWLPDAHGFVGTASPGDGDSHWWTARLYEFDTTGAGAHLLYAPHDPRLQIAEPRVSSDGRTVAFIGGLMSDFGSTGGDIFLLPVTGGEPVNVTRGQHASTTSIGFDCHGALMARMLRGDESQIVRVDIANPAREPQKLWSGQVSLSGHDAGRSLGCPSQIESTVREDFTTPPEILVGKFAEWLPLTSVNAGLTPAARVQSVHWKNGGFDLQGWLLLPAAARGKLALITLVHGGPAAASTPSFLGPSQPRALLDRGYALFLPNPRGSYGQGEAFTTANVRDFGYGDLRDILAGIKATAHIAPIDENRLGIMGGSYGGFMTMWAVTQTHVFKAAVAQAGISDWLSYYGENGIDQWMIPYFGASVYTDASVYARSAPINYIRNVRTPTLEYVGENDIECPAPQTLEFWHALQEMRVPTSIVIYPQEGHGLRDPAHLEDAQARVLAWFDRYLQP